MKNKFNYLRMCNIILVGLIIFNIFKFNGEKNNVYLADLNEGQFVGYLQKEPHIIENEDNNTQIEIEESPKEEVVETEKAIETLVGSLSGYGPDCYGCTTNLTASGKYVGEGNIYYSDAAYGTIRIVAGDSSYPFGTIVKISNVDFYNNEPFYAIVLDRGGDIGKNKKFLFDLLFANEAEAYNLGVDYNVSYEIIRLGY